MHPRYRLHHRAPVVDGFTVIEVLVAFAVAAILSLTFISAQHRALQVASEFGASWDQINLAQEYFLRRPFHQTRRASMGWVDWKGHPGVERRVDVDSSKRLGVLAGTQNVLVTGGWHMRHSSRYSLRIRDNGREETWDWLGVRP